MKERILFHILPTAKYFIIRKDYFIWRSHISFSLAPLPLLCYNTPKGGGDVEIYTFQSPYNTLMNIIYALGVILLGVVSFFLIQFFVGQVKAYHQSGEKFPRRLTAFLIAFCFVPIVGTVLFGNAFIKSVFYDMQMDRGNGGHYTPEQIEKDKARTKELEGMNLTILRICNLDIDRNFRGVC